MAEDFQNMQEYYINDEMNRYSSVCVAQFLIFFVNIVKWVIVCPFCFAISLSCLRFTVSDYPFGIIKFFLHYIKPFK